MTVIEDTKENLESRLEELRPYLEEASQIRRLLKALEGVEEGGGGGQVRHLPASIRKVHLLSFLRDQSLRDQPVVRIKELAEALQVSPGRAVQLVNELEAEGTAERVEGGVKITAIGLELPQVEVKFGGFYVKPTS